ncbi:FMN-binding negative transcriptional regulator [Dactylosporangium fulvum]|uniref:FMN-binding negative transcriptional regulator n=1 Tax=Dactylosporangium fulvum TaxID=53359 RepID=A0ABY5VSI5_9ACTN|nr:FMN-binding negative transcriptional regulator [Dactylosporangium fulvum]UWP80172.1 FMN-binding negative transcriptional regulator [Dactylosporangium fulvum]
MFVPSHYRIEDEEWHRRIIDGHPLATLTTNGATVPWATRLPALVAPDEPESGPLAGTEIVGHLNRANPHWKALADGTYARLMFDGPGGFVTPAVYPCDPSAPTWNFAAVHVCGRLRLIREPEETLEVVRWTAERLEGRFGAGWDQTSSVDYFRRIVHGVGAFRLSIESVEALFKLSQEKPADVQESVIRHYEADMSGANWPIARLMREAGMGCFDGSPDDAASVCPF